MEAMEQRRVRNRENSSFPASFSPENLNLNPYFYSPRRNSVPEDDQPNPQGFFSDEDQILSSAFSRLQLLSNLDYQTSPLLPSSSSIEDMRGQGMGGLGHCYPSGYGGQEWSNVCLRGGLMGLQSISQDLDFGGVHPNLMGGQSCWGYGTVGTGVGIGVFREDNARRMNAALDRGSRQGVYADECSSLQSKKSSPRRFNAQFPHLPPSNQNGTSRQNLDGFSNGTVLKNCNFLRPNSGNSEQRFESLSLRDLRGRIVPLAKDQNGSRILQEKLDKPDEGEIEMLVSEAVDYAAELMKNQFGSYFLQKLFGVASEEQRTRIIMVITNNSFQLVGICLNSHGARAMQKLLENLITPEQISLVMSALCNGDGVVRLATDPNGQHVVRHCVVNYSHEYNKHLLNEVAKNCFEIATDRSGCCVLQFCVENAHGETREHLINQIITNALHLAQDPFGNYVVQHLLSQKIPGVTAKLLGHLLCHFASMSCNKYASNVVEKFLTESGEEHSTIIIIELLNSPNAAMLLVDPFGNFVIQKALSVAKGYAYQQLSNLILTEEKSMRSNPYGRKILSWFEKKKPRVYTCTSKRFQLLQV